MDLKEWIIQFLKNKDIFQKKIVEMKSESSPMEVIYKDKKVLIFTQQDANFTELVDALEASNKDESMNITLICPNKRNNLNELIKHWQRIIDFPRFNMYFINPDAAGDKKWIIAPYIHSKISDPSSLKLGLETMFETVEEVS